MSAHLAGAALFSCADFLRRLRAHLALATLLFLAAGLAWPQANPDAGKDKPPAKPPEAKADPPAKQPRQPTVEISLQELEKLTKVRHIPDWCKLTGELKDNKILFEATFIFETRQPNMIVPLGLENGRLIDPQGVDWQKLSEQNLALQGEGEGFVLGVPRAGKYHVTLHLEVPVSLRRSGDKGGSDRGFSLGLPESPTTEILLKLPDEIKELRWKRMRETRWEDPEAVRTRKQGRWQIIGKAKMVDVVWKERDANTPPQANIKINVKLEEAVTVTTAEMQLEDPRGLAREWQLFVPFPDNGVKVVKAPVGVSCELVPALTNGQPYIVRFGEPTSEPFTVKVEVRAARKEPGILLVGPFYAKVAGAQVSQQGVIVVQRSAGGARGQFLDFKPNEWVHRGEVPKGPSWQDVRAVFDYGNFPAQLKEKWTHDPKVPLEIKWRTDKGSGEASVEHKLTMKLGRSGLGTAGLLIDVTSQIKIKSLSGGDYLDVQLPWQPKLGFLGTFPAAGFPAGVSLGGFAEQFPSDPALAEPIRGFSLLPGEDGNLATLSPPEALARARITFSSPVNKEVTQTLVGRFFVPMSPGDVQRFRIDLPRPLGIVERGGKVSVNSDNDIELLMGPPGVEFKTDWDSSFPPLDVSWRPYHPQFLVRNEADVTLLRGKEAHIRQQLTLTWTPRPGGADVPRTGTIKLPVPRNARGSFRVVGGKEVNRSDQDYVWVKLEGGDEPLKIEFYQRLPEGKDTWQVPLVAPEGATAVEAKVRVWCDASLQPEAVDPQERWRNRGREIVPGQRALPALVLFGSGPSLELTLRLPAADGANLPIMVCEKGLVEATIDEDGNHSYRARYVIQKLRGNSLSVRFPAPADTCIQRVTLDKFEIPPERDPHDRNVALLKIEPEILRALTEGKGQGAGLTLTIEFKVPANFAEKDTRWQTTLTGPVFLGDVFLGRVRWLVYMPANWVSVVAANVHPDFRWTLQKYLLAPEAYVSAGELAQWRQGANDAIRDDPSLVFSRRSQEPFVVVHFPQPTWLALCSGLLLALGLALHLLPMSRSIFWVVLLVLVAGMIAGGFLWPAWVPALLFGAQPGAVVLGMFLAIHWVLRERYRRQVIFMPGFTRLKPGSSLLHPPQAPRPREASTVDAPAPPSRGSSVQKST